MTAELSREGCACPGWAAAPSPFPGSLKYGSGGVRGALPFLIHHNTSLSVWGQAWVVSSDTGLSVRPAQGRLSLTQGLFVYSVFKIITFPAPPRPTAPSLTSLGPSTGPEMEKTVQGSGACAPIPGLQPLTREVCPLLFLGLGLTQS